MSGPTAPLVASRRAVETTRWTTYDVLSGAGADALLTLRGAHPGARVVRDAGAHAAAMARLYPDG